MSWLDRVEKFWRPFAIPGVTLHLIFGQFICYALSLAKPEFLGALALIPAQVLGGEFWRLFTFVLVPPQMNPLFLFFFWYLFYLMGDALESQWGAARYNVFLLIAGLATLLAAFLTPQLPATNGYLMASVFLAFAYLYPDFQIYLFFILPVKVKWLATFTWILYFLTFVGSGAERFLVLASVSSFLLFFGSEIVLGMRSRRARMARRVDEIKSEHEPVHRCVVCGVTDQSDPGMEFRYCSRCDGSPCYCRDHIRTHVHRTAPPPTEEPAAAELEET